VSRLLGHAYCAREGGPGGTRLQRVLFAQARRRCQLPEDSPDTRHRFGHPKDMATGGCVAVDVRYREPAAPGRGAHSLRTVT
jgi:hypothetical protein